MRDALTARAGSGARTAKLARRASAKDGASYRIAREAERRSRMRRAGLLNEAGKAEFSNGCERSEHEAKALTQSAAARAQQGGCTS